MTGVSLRRRGRGAGDHVSTEAETGGRQLRPESWKLGEAKRASALSLGGSRASATH